MLILVGADEKNSESPVAKRFGHAEYFIVYDTVQESFESYENNDEGHNHKNLEEFLDKGVEAFIVGNIGPHAFELINTPKSKIYLARQLTVKEAVDKFKKNELRLLEEPTVKHSIGHENDGHHHSEHHEDRGQHRHN